MQAGEKQRKITGQRAWLHVLLPAAMSMLLPGAGHLLIRRWGRAAIWFAGWVLVVGVSGSSHNPAVVALMVFAALDSFVFAWSDANAANERPGADSDEA